MSQEQAKALLNRPYFKDIGDTAFKILNYMAIKCNLDAADLIIPNEEFQENLSLSKSVVQNNLKVLDDNGFITRKKQHGKRVISVIGFKDLGAGALIAPSLPEASAESSPAPDPEDNAAQNDSKASSKATAKDSAPSTPEPEPKATPLDNVPELKDFDINEYLAENAEIMRYMPDIPITQATLWQKAQDNMEAAKAQKAEHKDSAAHSEFYKKIEPNNEVSALHNAVLTVPVNQEKGFTFPCLYPSINGIRTSYCWHYMGDSLFNSVDASNITLQGFAACVEQKTKLNPFGSGHSWFFNFEAIREAVSPLKKDLAPKEQEGNFACFDMLDKRFDQAWRDFFIFTAVIELACFQEQIIKDTSELDISGKDLEAFFLNNVQGFCMECLLACSESLPMLICKEVKKNFNPTSKNASLEAFLLGTITNKVIKLLSKEDTGQKCLERFKFNFVQYVEHQSFMYGAKTLNLSDTKWLDNIWGPNLERGLLKDLTTTKRMCLTDAKSVATNASANTHFDYLVFRPRLSLPLVLFRHFVALNLLTRIAKPEDRTRIAATFLRRSFIYQRAELERLQKAFVDDFHFFNMFKISEFRAEMGPLPPELFKIMEARTNQDE